MAEHANGYLTLDTRASQGRIANNLWPVLNRRRECSTALRGMPRTALAPSGISARFGLAASACQQGGCAALSASQPGGLAHAKADKSPVPGDLLTSVELK